MPKKSKDPSKLFAGSSTQQSKSKTKTAKPKKPKKPRGGTAKIAQPSTPHTPRTPTPKQRRLAKIKTLIETGIKNDVLNAEKATRFYRSLERNIKSKTKEELESITKGELRKMFPSANELLLKDYNRIVRRLKDRLAKEKRLGSIHDSIELSDIIGTKPSKLTKDYIDRLDKIDTEDLRNSVYNKDTKWISPDTGEVKDEYQEGDIPFIKKDVDPDEKYTPPKETDLVLRQLESMLNIGYISSHTKRDTVYADQFHEIQLDALRDLLSKTIDRDGRDTVAERCQENASVINEAHAFLTSSDSAEIKESYARLIAIITDALPSEDSLMNIDDYQMSFESNWGFKK